LPLNTFRHFVAARPSMETAMDKVKELVVTLGLAGGDVVHVAELKASGARRDLSAEEFAELLAQGEEETLAAALEEAYAAGAEDAAGDDAKPAAGVRILWDAAARQQLRGTIRRLVLARALQRMAAAPAQRVETKTASRKSPAKKGTGHGRGSHTEH
jgi:hypothetical protein